MAVTTVKKVFELKAGKSADKLLSYRRLPSLCEIKCLFPGGEAEIPFRFETGDLLWISTDSGTVWRVCYSYETKNIYYGSPLTGAILISNLMDLIDLGPEDTDKFAEFLACYGCCDMDIKKFKLRSNRNLLNALLSSSDASNAQLIKRLEEAYHAMTSRLLSVANFISDLIRNTPKSEVNLEMLARVDLVNRYYSSAANNKDAAENALTFENILTLAQRYPGLVEVKFDRYSINKESSSFFKDNYGIDFNFGYQNREPVELKDSSKVDRFLKRVTLLKNWLADIK